MCKVAVAVAGSGLVVSEVTVERSTIAIGVVEEGTVLPSNSVEFQEAQGSSHGTKRTFRPFDYGLWIMDYAWIMDSGF